MSKQKNLIMIAVAAVVLVAVNVGVLMAANKGAIAPIGNIALWGAFVVLNVASILWAVTLLGLQPLVIALSYVAGGALAFFGVRNAGDVSVAELITAGATYGAFGALAVGNATQKVRLAFFNKGQVPFVFIIVGLLVIDAGLNSGVSSAGVDVILKAVVLPFAVAGGVIGVVWSLLNRAGIGRKPSEVIAEADGIAEEKAASTEPDKLVMKMPEESPAVAKKAKTSKKSKPQPAKKTPAKKPQPAKKAEPAKPVVEPVPEPAVAKKVEPAKEVEPAKPVPEPAVAEKAPEPEFVLPESILGSIAPEEKEKEEAFFPLEIDTSDSEPKEEADEPFTIPTFDASLYGIGKDSDQEETVSVDLDEDTSVVENDSDPVVAKVQPASEQVEEPAKEQGKPGDWLGGHFDLLDKLK